VGDSETTCWTVIRAAAAGEPREREEFARRYASVIRAGLGARWRGTPLIDSLEDAAQEVFLDCFREGGALERVEPGRGGGFRAFLYGVVRNVARRFERDRGRQGLPLDAAADPPAPDRSLSDAFDRAWARALVRQAGERQAALARDKGAQARRRVDLLRLRFEEGLPVREIAARWNEDPSRVHHEYARARREYRAALLDVVREHCPGEDDDVERECERVLASLR
jgi:RNA polymerase sigma-70 factor (ECF subfamily)